MHRQGIGHCVQPAEADPTPLDTDELSELQRLLSSYGYGIEVTGAADETTRKVVDAFQRHFRPALVNGIADRSVLATARRLAG